ncbi:DUF368 domain-containing protein [Treponema lecithinolyticum]|uniref:DUF368 domain-containing protein n=1 Tax=Treponema lecithinolyticum ATCC 700332 TaxID=1321815 RepID=A0ABN0P0B0_TRELE|nr:DUF368 domain-containing protein [Treponema lecithinolyticum]ERJ93827.1 hypothetical protein HMPREF9193_00671 [Treponema lecithinolyticum ATCC 700332]
MQAIKLTLIGIVIGITNVIPGVSGGTVAVVFGIYDKLIELISLNIKKVFSLWKFWLPLAAGIAAGIVLFSKLMRLFFNLYPAAAHWFFIGLIAGCIPFLAVTVKKESARSSTVAHTAFVPASSTAVPDGSTAAERRTALDGSAPISDISTAKSALFLGVGWRRIAVLCAAAAVLIVLNKLNAKQSFYSGQSEPTSQTIVQTLPTFFLCAKLCAGTALAAAAAIIPGISGSFLLLILGIYNTVIQAVSDFNIPLLLPIAAGAAAGLLGGATFIRFLLAKAPSYTYSGVLGLTAGALAVLYPGFPAGAEAVFSVLLCAAGFAAAFFSTRRNLSTASA